MELTTGTRLGPYEVVSLLSAGGMGEVYRARDTRLDRSVALKILPPRVSATPMARERFEREARAISSLQHPNICTLYDVGSSNGTEYLVMELLEGESLAARLAKGPLPLDHVLRDGAAIADALAKAHRAGIIHRDLKPGNVMMTRGGPKLLDFGLARRDSEPALPGNDDATAVQAALTSDGVVVGTVPYMAPEQLEGNAVDARTDIFALGAVLYEMITARRAFEGVQPVAPPALNRLVMKCLAKDPEERWHSAADVASELRWIAESPDTAAVARKRTLPIAWTAAAALAILAGGIAVSRRPAQTPPTIRFTIDPPPNAGRFAVSSPSQTNIAISPDGQTIAYVAADPHARIWLRKLNGVPAPLEGTEGGASPFWSPDGRSLGFLGGGKLKIATLDPLSIQSVCDMTAGGLSAAWMSDGTIVFNQLNTTRGIWSVPSGGGTPKPLIASTGPASESAGPRAIGKTRSFFYSVIEHRTTDLWIGDLDGHSHRLLQNAGRAVYDPPFVVYERDGTLFSQRFDEKELRMISAAVPIAADVWFYRSLGTIQLDAAGGTMAYASPLYSSSLTWIDRSGRPLGEALPAQGLVHQPRISPDGKRMIASINDVRIISGDLWIADLERKALSRISFGEHDYDTPVWAPDGRSIAFGADVDGPPHVFSRALNTAANQQVTPRGDVQFASDWLADGRIFFTAVSRNTNTDIMLASPGAATVPWLQTPAGEADARISPDQRWVAYRSNESGRQEVYVAPLDRHSEPVRVSNDGGAVPAWSRDGRELYWIEGPALFVAPMTPAPGAPRKLYTAAHDIEGFDTAPDGRILVTVRDLEPSTQPLTVIAGWKSEAERSLAAVAAR